jgi:hypothetical protein
MEGQKACAARLLQSEIQNPKSKIQNLKWYNVYYFHFILCKLTRYKLVGLNAHLILEKPINNFIEHHHQ